MVTPLRRRYRRLRRNRLGAGLALTIGLSMLAGMTDAIGFMMIGSYVSFMSGNTTDFAAAMIRGEFAHALLLGGILACFVAGNALGEIVGRRIGRTNGQILWIVALLIPVPLVLPGPVWPILAVVLAMGMLNAAIEQVEGQAFGITFVTGALSRFGRGLGRRLTGDRDTTWTFQITPWVGMIAGAMVGAGAYRLIPQAGLLVPAGFSLGLGLAMLLIPMRWRARYTAPVAVRRSGPTRR